MAQTVTLEGTLTIGESTLALASKTLNKVSATITKYAKGEIIKAVAGAQVINLQGMTSVRFLWIKITDSLGTATVKEATIATGTDIIASQECDEFMEFYSDTALAASSLTVTTLDNDSKIEYIIGGN